MLIILQAFQLHSPETVFVLDSFANKRENTSTPSPVSNTMGSEITRPALGLYEFELITHEYIKVICHLSKSWKLDCLKVQTRGKKLITSKHESNLMVGLRPPNALSLDVRLIKVGK